MQKDFHYYATYCAARIAGYTHHDSMEIFYSAQLVDWCSVIFLSRLNAPSAAATTQLQLELMEVRTDPVGLQDFTRIWASFKRMQSYISRERTHTKAVGMIHIITQREFIRHGTSL